MVLWVQCISFCMERMCKGVFDKVESLIFFIWPNAAAEPKFCLYQMCCPLPALDGGRAHVRAQKQPVVGDPLLFALCQFLLLFCFMLLFIYRAVLVARPKFSNSFSEEMRATNLDVLRLKHKIFCFDLVSLQSTMNYRAGGEKEDKNIKEVRKYK